METASVSEPVHFLNPTEGTEAAVHRHNDPVDEARDRGAQPDYRPNELLRLSETPRWCVLDDDAPPLGEAPVFIGKHRTVLLPDEEAGGDSVDPHAITVALGEVHGEPAGKVLHRRLGRGVPGHPGDRPCGGHG